ncbi:two-component system response regulator [Enterovibrio norvegicus]|uniref:Two-component system response regulator n=2 Tax=Enterovibrio norvegicus TaxID=188144 RepID=A0ABV4L354_9GAMM|nr:two-component system response regulator [Enterovibrio norvegicus]OEF55086.1 two-component system response regulator [Enterovibrio norvegicus]SFP24307.1 putative two-component system response regulator [Enterovibrio norvegicus DSM 15893]
MLSPEIKTNKRATVLVVDDTPENLVFVSEMLRDKYEVKAATNGQTALAIVEKFSIDLILLDVVMPGMDGYEVCRQIKAKKSAHDIPVIFLTSKSKTEDQEYGFSVGAADYIMKPMSPPITMARIKIHLENKASQDFLHNQNEFLEAEVQRRLKELSVIQDVTINALASLAETRDQETGNHIVRTQYYVKILADQLYLRGKFTDIVTPEYITMVFKTAPLHDIGKVGIPDAILLKPGKLTADEFEIMKSHAKLGFDAIMKAEKEVDAEYPFLKAAKEIALGHHEKWDGSGYPQGLVGEDIPLSARLMAVADVFDALVSKRVYKSAMSHDEAFEIIREGKGSHFDPMLVDLMFEMKNDFIKIAETYKD